MGKFNLHTYAHVLHNGVIRMQTDGTFHLEVIITFFYWLKNTCVTSIWNYPMSFVFVDEGEVRLCNSRFHCQIVSCN